MTKKIIAFDLDDTLAITKSPISDRIGNLLVKLLDNYEICVISGGKFERFTAQVVNRLEATPTQLTHLHLMPTCGTRYYVFDTAKGEWSLQYAEDLNPSEKEQIISIAETAAKESGLWPEKPYGEVIEDRDSQISISLLGQLAPPDKKYAWADENSERRLELVQSIAKQLPDFEVRAGGTTTIDITHKGIDKAYGMGKLLEALGNEKKELLFIGDKLQEGGNDYPVKAMGVDTLEVGKWEDTAYILDGILAVS